MFKIRTIRPKDFNTLEKLAEEHPELNNIYKNRFISSAQSIIPPNLRLSQSIHVAADENNILGFVILECVSKSNTCWQINKVFVQDSFRKEGVGEELLKYALSVYGGFGIEYFLGEVDAKNFAALTLFHSCGFRRYAKVLFYHKDIECKAINESPQLNDEFIIRSQIKSDLNDIEKLEVSSIPADLRPALGRSKNYFKNKNNPHILIDKSRNIIIGWFNYEKNNNDDYFIELIISPGWTHLYENLLNTIIAHSIDTSKKKISVNIKVIDYYKELAEILSKLGYLPQEVRELLVRTVWQKVKEKRSALAKIGFPSTQPIPGS